uniref:Acetyl-CoA acetyltransferase n=1 Tax=uncultured gamma proteobacterium EB080_L93H08 TaxID=710973 RepID=E0Y2S5_9GAMM|nr:acetyl-CoA acetyltransferase [uncultured gamma proteobacterium EB080_L93H08]
MSGQAEVIIAGGVESASDAPIGYKKRMRKKLIKAQKIKSPLQGLKFLFSLRPTDFLPDPPSISEFFTKRSMGDDGRNHRFKIWCDPRRNRCFCCPFSSTGC